MKRISNYVYFSLAFVILVALAASFNSSNDKIIKKWSPKQDVVEMPIVKSQIKVSNIGSSTPLEQRDEKYYHLLSASVKISANGASGSGTICYYDLKENWAYVISCGHLWDGNKTNAELIKNPKKAKIITWYHNSKKLEEFKTYDAEILFWSNTRGKDCSCLRFKPDWTPNYYPIASRDFSINKGEKLNSLGCDGGREVARYEVEFLELRGDDVITIKNSPRPGRSGGGLITDSGWYVGICWGTSDVITGNGIGYFTPLDSIHKVFKDNNHEWLTLISKFSGRDIPIYDWNSPKKKFNWDYIPTPFSISF